jgi:hypothetical protein
MNCCLFTIVLLAITFVPPSFCYVRFFVSWLFVVNHDIAALNLYYS